MALRIFYVRHLKKADALQQMLLLDLLLLWHREHFILLHLCVFFQQLVLRFTETHQGVALRPGGYQQHTLCQESRQVFHRLLTTVCSDQGQHRPRCYEST